jgi:hypothetical protein
MSAKTDIVQHCHAAEHLHLLKGSGQTQLRSLVGPEFINLLPFVIYISILRVVKAVNNIHHYRFTGSVRADN